MERRSLALAMALLATSCTSVAPNRDSGHAPRRASSAADPPRQTAPAVAVSANDYLYELLTPAALGVARVFDDGQRTYVFFAGAAPAGLMVFDEEGRPLSFTADHGAVVIDTVRLGLLFRTPTQSSFAASRTARAATAGVTAGGASLSNVLLPVELAGERAELLQSQSQLSETSAALRLAAAGKGGVSSLKLKAELDQIDATLNGLNARLIRTHFKSGSALLLPGDPVKQALILSARDADEVRIRGHADAMGSLETNLRLARERALSVRRVLLEGGIEEQKLHMSFAAADYLASNDTAEGRAQNRRVDVLFVGLKTAQVAPAASLDSKRPEGPGATNVR